MKEKLNSIYYALLFEIIIIPFMGYVTYTLYNNVNYISLFQNYSFLRFVLLIILIAINIAVMYGYSLSLNKVFKVDTTYCNIVELFGIAFALWAKVYFASAEGIRCTTSSVDCLDAMKFNKIATAILVGLFAYYIVFAAINKMVKAKIEIKKNKNKKK